MPLIGWQDAQADFPPRRRWPLWFSAFVKAGGLKVVKEAELWYRCENIHVLSFLVVLLW